MAKQDLLRKIPSVEVVLQDAGFARAAAGVPRPIVVDCVRAAVEAVRGELQAQPPDGSEPQAIHRRVLAQASRLVAQSAGPYYHRVVNATGIILHTALGRAVLAPAALRQIELELSGYSLLQADLESGQRAKRDARIEWLLGRLTGAEAATVVNNNAAATMIVLATIAAGREVIVSRGQLVEIGGSFRLPDVMAASGAKLVEVGTTNRTHARDYTGAVTANTAAILRVHPSNYRISGFTAEVSLEELATIAHSRGLLLVDDLGAGPLVDFSRFGFEHEPTLQESVQAGADLITASADKLIGGSQGGLILGRRAVIESIRTNPLARILRVGKLTLAALEATLTLFLDEATALAEVPTLRMLSRTPTELGIQAERIAAAVRTRTKGSTIEVIDGFSQMGSGPLPTQDIPSRLVAIGPSSVDPAPFSPDDVAGRLRRGRPPVFARVHKGRLLCDPRTLLEGDEQLLIEALIGALNGGDSSPQET
jgi:L-seryl-tRNA(Ser) seleniumtransferase